MTKKKSFYIRSKQVEASKVKLRQNLVCELVNKPSSQFSDLFKTNFPLTRVGTQNCENLVGSVEVPVGVVGPVKAQITKVAHDNSVIAKETKSFLIPLATLEGALVASISRGSKALNCGETKVNVKRIGMSRSLVFECSSIEEALLFEKYFADKIEIFIKFCEETSKHLKFLSYEVYPRGKLLYFRFVFETDQAMGMNMITIALNYAWSRFKLSLPSSMTVSLLTISGNVCSDKKDSLVNRLKGRGYFVTVETKLALSEVSKTLKVDASKLVKTHLVKNLVGSNVAGSFAQNMHAANALAAFYLATGQDVAHTVAGSEASIHFEVLPSKKQLYVALSLPNVSLGSVGGGTWLPSQTQARQMILPDNKEESSVSASDLAVAAGLATLAAEISGLAALTTHTLAQAHAKLGRSKV